MVFGTSVVLSCRVQLRLSPQPWYATRYFASLAAFEGMLVLPAASYRYFFHPDWSSMYLFQASNSTGLVAFGWLLLLFCVVVGAFWLGAYCARLHQEWLLLVVLAIAIGGISLLSTLGAKRLRLVGSYEQWSGRFGLRSIVETDLLPAVLIMGLCVLIGWIYILYLFSREGTSLRRASH